MCWRVLDKKKRFIGIIETNYAWAFGYWTKRGFKLEAVKK